MLLLLLLVVLLEIKGADIDGNTIDDVALALMLTMTGTSLVMRMMSPTVVLGCKYKQTISLYNNADTSY